MMDEGDLRRGDGGGKAEMKMGMVCADLEMERERPREGWVMAVSAHV